MFIPIAHTVVVRICSIYNLGLGPAGPGSNKMFTRWGGTIVAEFEQKPMGIGTVIGVLILTAQYVGLTLVIVALIKGVI